MRPRDDAGSVAFELALLAIVFFFLIGLAVVFGRLNYSLSYVESVARTAARDISIARDTSDGVAAAEEYVHERLLDSGACESVGFDEDVTDELVVVTISCEVDLSDAALAGLPGSHTYDDIQATEVFDQYRERQP